MQPYDGIGAGLTFAALFLSVSAFYIAVEWRKVRHAQIECDLKKELVNKGLSTEDIERILKATVSTKE